MWINEFTEDELFANFFANEHSKIYKDEYDTLPVPKVLKFRKEYQISVI